MTALPIRDAVSRDRNLHDVADLLRRAFATTPEDWCEFCDQPMPRTGECPCWSAL